MPAMLCSPALMAAVVEWLFLPLAAWPLYLVLRRSGNTRNLFLVGLRALLALAKGLFHAAVQAWQAQRSVRLPLLWILHLPYAWIGVGFALLALAQPA